MIIEFEIKNAHNLDVQNVQLSKFFQMVFVGNDRKSLHIYTATLIGRYFSDEIIDFSDIESFTMRYQFTIKDDDDNVVRKIVNEDITLGTANFLDEIECIKRVWGDQCKIIEGPQDVLTATYEELTGIKSENLNLGMLVDSSVLLVKDSKKSELKKMNTLALSGVQFQSQDYNKTTKKYNELQEISSYTIRKPEYCPKGTGIVNWVKTTIEFEYLLDEQSYNYIITNPTQIGTYDFTWYFSPPVKSFIDVASSDVEVKYAKPSKYNEDFEETNTSNLRISGVANKTTVNFSRWKNDEKIGFRQKYRLLSKGIFQKKDCSSQIEEINIFIDTAYNRNRGNRQFLLGIFLSFLLAFGIDSNRLEFASAYFPLPKLFMADFWWILLLMSVTLNFFVRPPRGIKLQFIENWRKFNLISSFLWFLYVFCLSRSEILTIYIFNFVHFLVETTYNKFIVLDYDPFFALQFLYFVILSSNFILVFKNIKTFHDPILNSIFGFDEEFL